MEFCNIYSVCEEKKDEEKDEGGRGEEIRTDATIAPILKSGNIHRPSEIF